MRKTLSLLLWASQSSGQHRESKTKTLRCNVSKGCLGAIGGLLLVRETLPPVHLGKVRVEGA